MDRVHSKRHKLSPFGRLLKAVMMEYEKIGPWNEALQKDLPKRWEKHGDLVLLPDNCFTLPQWRLLGRKVWMVAADCLGAKRVGRKRRIQHDEHRTPRVELLLGGDGWVVHVDNGISYHYDVTKCMFSIGNIGEKQRVAGMDCSNETVVDLFAGIGYFTLPYLVHAKASMVHACEWNPEAVEALLKNLHQNKVEDRCLVHAGDCRTVCPVGVADRVNLGLLPSARAYWLTACKALKRTGGVLHIHENVTSSELKSDGMIGDSVTVQYQSDTLSDQPVSIRPHFQSEWNSDKMDEAWRRFATATALTIRGFLDNSSQDEWRVIVSRVGKVKSYAPRIDHIVLDLFCKPIRN